MALIKPVLTILISLLLFGCGANSGDIDLAQMMANIAESMPDVLAMVTAASYIMGFTIVMMGIYKLKEYGEARTMMSSQVSIWPIIITLSVGSMLIFFPSTIEVTMQTLFDYSSPISYSGTSGSESDELISDLVIIMQIIGAISFIRGLLLLNTSSHRGAQPGGFSKGITFVVGGILAINMYGTWEVLVNTIT
jgi:intracellular multiplication protein IcmC